MPDLTIYNQQQLLRFIDELNEEEKELLINQIKNIDFEFMNNLYKQSFIDQELDINKIKPLRIIDSRDINNNSKYQSIGKKIVEEGKYAVLLMSGGFGSRLGLDIPKGCLKLCFNNQEISIFELFINQLKAANMTNKSTIKLYIMTADNNYDYIINFFMNNNYFNYPKESIVFFKQGKLPIIDENGKIVLNKKNNILFGPNGNGDVFNALKIYDLISDMKKERIEYVLFSTIDNVLNNLVDYSFIGATIGNGYKLSSKTISKENEEEKDWIFCKYKNRPFMLPTKYIDKSITNKKDKKGNYLYREKNITCHLIAVDLIELFSNLDLKYHRAFKNNKYLDNEGNIIKINDKNSYKFEKFIFDAFECADDMLLYKVTREYFQPIKEQKDIKIVEKILEKK